MSRLGKQQPRPTVAAGFSPACALRADASDRLTAIPAIRRDAAGLAMTGALAVHLAAAALAMVLPSQIPHLSPPDERPVELAMATTPQSQRPEPAEATATEPAAATSPDAPLVAATALGVAPAAPDRDAALPMPPPSPATAPELPMLTASSEASAERAAPPEFATAMTAPAPEPVEVTQRPPPPVARPAASNARSHPVRAPSAPAAAMVRHDDAPAAPVPAQTKATAASPAPSSQAADAEAALEARVRVAIQAATRYPASARMMGLAGRARVMLDYRSGAVANPALAQSSGAPILDEAALAAVQSAHYPPAPPEIADRLLRLIVWVEFRAG